MRALFLVTMLSAVALGDEPKPTKAEGLAAPPYLNELARQLLRRRMERHGKDAVVLLSSVVLLKRDVAQRLAEGIANEPRIVRPLPDAKDALNTSLPEKFFVLQDELRARAKTVAEAAKTKSDKELAEAFGQLTNTCVSCHSVFLNPAD